MSAGCDFGAVITASARLLFCELVSKRLIVYQMAFDTTMSEEAWIDDIFEAPVRGGGEMYIPPADHRLAILERGQNQLYSMISEVRLALKRLEIINAIHPAVVVAPSAPSLEQSDSPSPSSVYVCPFCLCRQKSPKSHVEHLQNMAKGNRSCRVDLGHLRHAQIMMLFSNDIQQFVAWWCGHLRCSKDASQVTPSDIAAFSKLQSKLETAIFDEKLPE